MTYPYYFEGQTPETEWQAERVYTDNRTVEFTLDIIGFSAFEILYDFQVRGEALHLVGVDVYQDDLKQDKDSLSPIVKQVLRNLTEEVEALHIQNHEKDALIENEEFRAEACYDLKARFDDGYEVE